MNEASSIILYLTNLNDFDNSLKLNYTKLVYEYIDELSIFFDDLEYGRKLHLEAIKKSDLVVATALRLYDETKEITDKVILSENAGDYDFFSKTKSVKSANEVSNLKNKYDCLIGYYGMLADWFDFDIIKKIAKKNKNWAWVLIGPIYPNFNLEKEELNKYDNIHVLGPKPYNELPSYIKDIDILTIPFKLNDITASTSPVKLFEYMAASKPIITSDMIECRRYESVNIYHSEEELEEIIKKQ